MATPTKAAPLKELNQESPLLPNTKTIALQDPTNKIEMTQNSSSHNNNGNESCKCKISAGLGTPDRLKVPKPFKYPERYTSPTDHMISPISKGLLARSKRGGALLPPSKIQSKIRELQAPDVGQIQL